MTDTTPAKKKGASRLVTPILAIVAVLAIGLFGGILIGQHTASSTSASGRGGASGFSGGGEGFGGGTGTEGGFGGGTGTEGGTAAAGGFTSGTVVSNSDGKIVLKTTAGKTVTVTTSDSTSVTKTTTSKVSALTKGETVSVVGTADSDGNVTATRVTEGAVTGGFGGGQRTGGEQG
jgi:hypothetical protein